MYRRCVFCGWGRKECNTTIKFYKIPDDPGLQKLQWMQVLGSHGHSKKNKKVDSVCSLHFASGKPCSNPNDVDFTPSLLLEKEEISDEIKKKHLRKYTEEEETVKLERDKRLQTLGDRLKRIKELTEEEKASWPERLKERRRLQGIDEDAIISIPLCCAEDSEPSPSKKLKIEVDYQEFQPQQVVEYIEVEAPHQRAAGEQIELFEELIDVQSEQNASLFYRQTHYYQEQNDQVIDVVNVVDPIHSPHPTNLGEFDSTDTNHERTYFHF